MVRRRSLHVIFTAIFILLGLYFLTTSFRLMMYQSPRYSKQLLGGHLSWMGFNFSRTIASNNITNRGIWDYTFIKGTHSTGDVKATRASTVPFKVVHSPDSNNLRTVKVLCWIMTHPANLYAKAIHIKRTWGPRCDVTLYMSTEADPSFPAIALDVREGRKSLWNKTAAAFKYVYEHHFEDADWFMKADDDTYVIVENLRYFLRDKNSSAPIYYGHHFKVLVEQGYMSGGSGYVLSKEALRRFVVNGHPRCATYKYGAEDVGMGECMEGIGVVAGDTRDSLNRSRFIPTNIRDFLNGRLPAWYHQYKKYETIKGIGCCSDYLISCHYVPPSLMYFLEYAVYHLRPASDDGNHLYHLENNTTLPI